MQHYTAILNAGLQCSAPASGPRSCFLNFKNRNSTETFYFTLKLTDTHKVPRSLAPLFHKFFLLLAFVFVSELPSMFSQATAQILQWSSGYLLFTSVVVVLIRCTPDMCYFYRSVPCKLAKDATQYAWHTCRDLQTSGQPNARKVRNLVFCQSVEPQFFQSSMCPFGQHRRQSVQTLLHYFRSLPRWGVC